MTSPHYVIKLYENGELNQEELSSIYYIDKAATARSLKRLEKKGYIKRLKDKDDKRSYKLYVTQKALLAKPRIYNALESWDKTISINMTTDELKEISLGLKEMSLRALEQTDNIDLT